MSLDGSQNGKERKCSEMTVVKQHQRITKKGKSVFVRMHSRKTPIGEAVRLKGKGLTPEMADLAMAHSKMYEEKKDDGSQYIGKTNEDVLRIISEKQVISSFDEKFIYYWAKEAGFKNVKVVGGLVYLTGFGNPYSCQTFAKKLLEALNEAKPVFIPEPFGLPRELQPKGMFRRRKGE